MKGKRRIIPGLANKAHFLLIKLIPDWLILRVAHMVMRRYHNPR